jgi:glycerophosphoryl diester phosphodiesterase
MEIHGHRGCRGEMPENSIPGFLRAIDIGCDYLEMDVVLSADEKVVVSHDPFLDPKLFGKDFHLNNNTFLELDQNTISSYTYGKIKDERFPEQMLMPVNIPSLHKVVTRCNQYGLQTSTDFGFNIEIKHYREWKGIYQFDYQTIVDRVISVLEETGSLSRVIIQSFSMDVISYLDQAFPQVRKGVITESGEISGIDDLINRYTLSHIAPWYADVTRSLVTRIQGNGSKIIPWTVNSVQDMKQMISLGVDGIITDHPTILKDVLGN